MAGNINRVTLVGNLTRDPELKHLPSGTRLLAFGLAVNGRKQERVGPVDGQAELLRREGVGQPGRELRAAPRQGTPRRRSTAGSTGRQWESTDGSASARRSK